MFFVYIIDLENKNYLYYDLTVYGLEHTLDTHIIYIIFIIVGTQMCSTHI
jgi:hypothetical protein